ncbi:hypothetical protein QFZ74_005170 [Streptomyces sp. V3I7]|nr:hypothetical protein [Streptomyces sp. V3I7]
MSSQTTCVSVPSSLATSARVIHSGYSSGAFFCMKDGPSMPSGYRSSISGRPRSCGSMKRATDR